MNTAGAAAPGRVCGVVVTYHPDSAVVENVAAMVRECGRVIVVDNGSAPAALAPIVALPGVELVALPGNEGLAAALNHGAGRALLAGYGWIITFDQDSRPEPGFAAALWTTHERLPAAAVIGPCIEEAGTMPGSYRWLARHPRWPGFFQRRGLDGALDDVSLVVTSGSLVELAAWRDLGRFEAGFFIDYIDIDFCLRVLRGGRTVAVATAAVLRHRLGDREQRRVLGRDIRPMHHAPFRHFYMARNRVATWRRHALAVPHWALFDLCFFPYNLLRVLLFERDRWAKVRAVVRGTWHGLLGRSGPMP